MSREVRRVPVDFAHPVESNPYWYHQLKRLDLLTMTWTKRPAPRLHAIDEKFVSLHDDYPGALQNWESGMDSVRQRSGFDWGFARKHILTGHVAPNESWIEPTLCGYANDGYGEEVKFEIYDEDDLFEYLLFEKTVEKPDPDDYLPVFDVPADELGWCLYSTTPEGHPVTPVFATAEELIDHLATVGEDYDQIPYRREAAQKLVDYGRSIGSFASTEEPVLNSTRDIDPLST